jgi:hypothetical protein
LKLAQHLKLLADHVAVTMKLRDTSGGTWLSLAATYFCSGFRRPCLARGSRQPSVYILANELIAKPRSHPDEMQRSRPKRRKAPRSLDYAWAFPLTRHHPCAT